MTGDCVIPGRRLISRGSGLVYTDTSIPVTKLGVEFYAELERLGYVDRLKRIRHYGIMRVNRKYQHTRYDYVCQQIFLHSFAKRSMKDDAMLYSYNNKVRMENGICFTLYDAMIILTFAANIGHFKNTFAGSQAAIRACCANQKLKEAFLTAAHEERGQTAFNDVFQSGNHMRLQLANALLLLERCDATLQSVAIARELLYMYLDQPSGIPDEKKEPILYVYRQIRDIAYLQSDLPCAAVPMRLIGDESSLKTLIRELFRRFNNAAPAQQMIQAVKKLLDDAFYNRPDIVFRREACVRRIVRDVTNKSTKEWMTYLLSEDSPFNRSPKRSGIPLQGEPLKLTFSGRTVMAELEARANSVRGLCCAAYMRRDGGYTVLIGMRKSCQEKAQGAWRALKIVTAKYMNGGFTDDTHILLTVKFFLRFLFSVDDVRIDGHIPNQQCVFAVRGHRARIRLLDAVIAQIGDADNKHEVEVLRDYLSNDRKNDVCIAVPSSVKACRSPGNSVAAEFDGLLIYPNRVREQVVFFEAKNRKDKPSRAKRALKIKFDGLSLACGEDDIRIIGKDAYYKYTI